MARGARSERGAPLSAHSALAVRVWRRAAPTAQEESLNFAVECMQTDIGHAKQQLAALKAQVGI